MSDLVDGQYDEAKMREEFRNALSNWRGDSTIDEKEEYPNEDEG